MQPPDEQDDHRLYEVLTKSLNIPDNNTLNLQERSHGSSARRDSVLQNSCSQVNSSHQVHQNHHHEQLPGSNDSLAEVDRRNLAPAQNLHTNFLRNVPHHTYTLPAGGSVNATMAEIIALFPAWHQNRDLAIRFMNNGIDSAVHFAILSTHRDPSLISPMQPSRMRAQISIQYQKIMRSTDPFWNKLGHRAPDGWNSKLIQINSFKPDAANKPDFTPPPPMMFKELAVGLKKLPGGDDAADLTRALEYAMQNHRQDSHGNVVQFMFPDDLQAILDHIGRTNVTEAHSDPAVIRRYAWSRLRKTSAAGRALQAKEEKASEVPGKVSSQTGHVLMLPEQQLEWIHYTYPQPDQALQEPSPYSINLAHSNGSHPSPSRANLGGMLMTPDPPFTHQHLELGYTHHENEAIGPNSGLGPQPRRQLEQDATAAIDPQLLGVGPPNPNLPSGPGEYFGLPEIPDICRVPDLEPEGEEYQNQQQLWAEDMANWTVEEMEALIAAHQDINFSFDAPSPDHQE